MEREASKLATKQEAVSKEALSHLLILEQLKNGDKYPYQIIQGITSKFGSNYKPSTGVVYPSLYRMQEKGYIVKNKRFYHITESGRRVFNEQYEDFLSRIEDFYEEKQFLKQYHEALKRLSRVIYQTDRDFMQEYERKIVSKLNDIADKIENMEPI